MLFFLVNITVPPAFEKLGNHHCMRWHRLLTSKSTWISSPFSYNNCWMT